MEKYFTGIFIARVFLCLVLCSSLIFSGAKAQQLEKVELTNISGDAEVLFEEQMNILLRRKVWF